MSSNYTTHLEFELRTSLGQAHQLKTLSGKAQAIWIRARQSESEDETAAKKCDDAREAFRARHRHHVDALQYVGELQEELFETAEAEEDWHQ